MGLKRSCSGVREDSEPSSTKVCALEGLEEAAAEMEAVAVAFRGVENLNGRIDWEVRGPDHGSSGHREKQQKQENNHVDQTCANRLALKDAEPHWTSISRAECESQRRRLWSYFRRLLPPTTSTDENPVELVEFARDLSNENNAFQA